MKVWISKYRNHWLSPYTIAEKLCFWREIDYDEPLIEKWSDRLEPISKAIKWFLDIVHPRIKYVKVDYYDTWNMDNTLASIILPMLKQLKNTQHGYAIVDAEDVPIELQGTTTENYDDQQCLQFYHDDMTGDSAILA